MNLLERLGLPASGLLPRWLIYAAVIAVVASWLPLLLIAHKRVSFSKKAPVRIIQDMAAQPKHKAQGWSTNFRGRRTMQPPVPGTIGRGQLQEDDWYYRGHMPDVLVEDPETGQKHPKWYDGYPPQLKINQGLLNRGYERFNVFCGPCHGEDGYGQGAVHVRADKLKEPKWIPPTSLHSEVVRDSANGYLFDVITNGVRNMSGYGSQIPVEDRWAIIAHIRVLQLSQNVDGDELPPEDRDKLR